jgi:hypothetical protein
MKIALCFFGQIRDLQKGFTEYNQNLLNNYDIDIFAHVWNDPNVDSFAKLFTPVSYAFEDQVLFDMSRYSNAYGIELQHSSAHERAFNSISQFYSFNNVCKLRSDYETKHGIKYDLCIKSRIDIYFKSFNINLTNLTLDQYHVPSDPVGFIYNDVMAIASPRIMDIVATRYNKLNEWYDSGDHNFIPEYVTNKILNENNIMINRVDGFHCDLSRTK